MYNLLYSIYKSFIKIRIFGLNEFPYKIVFEYFYGSVYDTYYSTIFCFDQREIRIIIDDFRKIQ